MSIERFKICLDSLLQGGVACKNPTIKWTGLGNTEISCPAGTNCNCVEIQVPSDSPKKCFTVQVDCEDCDKCPPVIITKCLCSDNDNCGPCEVCIDGQCVSRCPDRVCDEERNICVDCNNDGECSDGKICNAGRCQCPPERPFQDENGRCVKCKGNGDCPSCTECVDGDCIPKRCGTGECNPTTGDCVECLSSGNCTKPNQCCVNGKCTCCDGFIYNPITDTCEEVGECRDDTQCPECYICVNKECLPRICPTGYVCINDKCEKICECSAGPCSKTESCVPYNSELCYCNKCEGDCTTNANCGYGCFCDNGTCKPNPCGVTVCNNANDCGENCGCFGGLCVPCSTFGCTTDCNQINGCKCLGSNCASDPCTGPCANGADCGPGCGCVDGMCVSCDKLSCTNLDCSNSLGCNCINNQCADVQGCEGPCSIAGDCGIGCTCYQGKCTPCADFTCDDCDNHDGCDCNGNKCGSSEEVPCTEKDLFLTKDDSRCTLEGKLVSDQCCTCEPIEYSVEQTKLLGSDFKYSVSLFKNGVKLSDINVENEDQYTGQYKLTVTFSNSPSIVKYKNVVPADLVKDVVEFDPITVPTGALGMKATVQISSKLIFASSCEYHKALLATFTNNTLASIVKTGDLLSNGCRNPIFTWYKSATPVFSSTDIFRKVYVPLQSGQTYIDELNNLITEFESFDYYQLEVDCSCDKQISYGSPCEPVRGKLIFCNPDEFTLLGSDCNKQINIAKASTCLVNHRGPISWVISIKTVETPTYTAYTTVSDVADGLGWAFPATVLNSTSAITSVKIAISGDICDECTLEYEIEPDTDCCLDQPTLTIELDCANLGILATVETYLSIPLAGCVVNLYDTETKTTLLASSITDGSGEVLFSGLSIGETYWVDVPTTPSSCDPYNCIDIQSMLIECNECVGKSVTASYNTVSQILNILLSSIDGGNTYSYKVDGSAFTNNTAIVLSNGVHAIQVTETYPDTSICVWSGNVVIENCAATVLSSAYSWDSGTELLEITAIGGGTAPYIVTFNGVNYTGITTGGIDISSVGVPNGLASITITDSNGCYEVFNVLVDRCVGFEGNAVYNCDTLDLLLNWNNGTAPYTYQVKDSDGVTITSNTTGLTTATFNTTTILPNGDYSLIIRDANGCEDIDEFAVACVCSPAPSFDIFRIGTVTGTDPNEFLLSFDVSNLANVVYPIELTVYAGGTACTNDLVTPFSLTIPSAPGTGTVPITDVSWIRLDPSDGLTSGWVGITDANGCTACNAISIFA